MHQIRYFSRDRVLLLSSNRSKKKRLEIQSPLYTFRQGDTLPRLPRANEVPCFPQLTRGEKEERKKKKKAESGFTVKWECLVLSGAGGAPIPPCVLQLGRPNEISDSNINSSGSLKRTMRGNWLSKESHYGSSCGIGRPCLQRLLGTEGWNSTPHQLALGPSSWDGYFFHSFFSFYLLWFPGTKNKTKILLEPEWLLLPCMCCGVEGGGQRGLID